MNELTIVNTIVFHNLHRNITHLAVVTRSTFIKFENLKAGENGKEPKSRMMSGKKTRAQFFGLFIQKLEQQKKLISPCAAKFRTSKIFFKYLC